MSRANIRSTQEVPYGNEQVYSWFYSMLLKIECRTLTFKGGIWDHFQNKHIFIQAKLPSYINHKYESIHN